MSNKKAGRQVHFQLIHRSKHSEVPFNGAVLGLGEAISLTTYSLELTEFDFGKAAVHCFMFR
jgi:hypothetical protein